MEAETADLSACQLTVQFPCLSALHSWFSNGAPFIQCSHTVQHLHIWCTGQVHAQLGHNVLALLNSAISQLASFQMKAIGTSGWNQPVCLVGVSAQLAVVSTNVTHLLSLCSQACNFCQSFLYILHKSPVFWTFV
jgi:hypothetical protein